MAKQRTILEVIELTPDVGAPFLYIDWHPDITNRVDPDRKDDIIEIVEGILAVAKDESA